jgi:Histidine kinase-like ATPase domain
MARAGRGPTRVPGPAATDLAARKRLNLSARLDSGATHPRVARMPADWWDSPSTVGCPLSHGPQFARAARRLTRNTLRGWDLISLAEDAEMIVGELAANAVTHAMPAPVRRPAEVNLGLRLQRRTSEVVCAVLDPSAAPPVLKAPGGADEPGRGLQMVDALSDVWGWSPVAGYGKAVWAILLCA